MLARSKGDDMSNAKFINDLNKQVNDLKQNTNKK